MFDTISVYYFSMCTSDTRIVEATNSTRVLPICSRLNSSSDSRKLLFYPLIVQPLAPYVVLVHHIFMTLQYTFDFLTGQPNPVDPTEFVQSQYC